MNRKPYKVMKSQFLVRMTALWALLLAACTNEPDHSVTPNEKSNFAIEILSTTETSVEFRITPSNEQMTYVVLVDTQANFDLYEDEADCINDDLDWFETMAAMEELSLEEYLPGVLKQGELHVVQESLRPGESYYLYTYGLTHDGLLLTPLHKALFTTRTADKVELDFDIEVSEIGYTEAMVEVVPSNSEALYFINVFSEEDFQYYGGDREAFAEHLLQLRSYYYGRGATIEQMIANFGSVGESQLPVQKLRAGTKYMAYAIGINDNFIANSVATVVEFETLAANTSDLEFEVDITHIDYDHIMGTVTPSSNDESYICSVQLAEAVDWYESEEEFMEAIISDINYWDNMELSLRQGPISLDHITGLNPKTDYVVVCFGYDGAPTTAPCITPFTTAEASGDPEQLEVSFEVAEITHNMAKITTIPSVGAYYFTAYVEADRFDEKVAELGSVDYAVAYFANDEIDYGAYWFDCTRAEYLSEVGASIGRQTTLYSPLEPQTSYVAYAVAVDIRRGDLASTRGFVSAPFRTLEKVVSDAKVSFEFSDYYDGTALAELDPSRFLNCKGYAVLPYTVRASDSAVAWYTTISLGDYTEWGCTDDDIYAELITYGYEWGVESISENRESGVAILSYDTAYSFLGMARNAAGEYGVGTLEVVTLSPDGVSPAEEFVSAVAPTMANRQLTARQGARLPKRISR